MANRIETRLADAGFTLPDTSPPLAAYQPAVRAGGLVLTAGQLPMLDGALIAKGKVGDGADDVDRDLAGTCAEQCVLNGLAAIRTVVDLDEVAAIVRVVGYVNADPDFTDHPGILNAASRVVQIALGASGQHARSAVGVASLPLGAPIEIELTAVLR